MHFCATASLWLNDCYIHGDAINFNAFCAAAATAGVLNCFACCGRPMAVPKNGHISLHVPLVVSNTRSETLKESEKRTWPI